MQARYLAIIAVGSVACLLTANIVAVKLVTVFGATVPGGVFVYPMAFLMGDVLTEVYGYRTARQVIWLGFVANVLFVAIALIVLELPSPDYWDKQREYEEILGYTPRLLAGSFCAYLLGDFANALVMSRLKVLTGGRLLWARTISSTVLGQAIDSAVFMVIAFGGNIPWSSLLETVLTVWLFKIGIEIGATPLTYMVTSKLKRLEGMDTYDHEIDYNPFRIL